ncbi:MAG: hypothetical protein SGJ19_05240 [Planctomycetia bacterium]|nr:hypothetical protein [Planctomycetia bacterium]
MEKPDINSQAVGAQLAIYQGIITRMANNAASCKTLAITIVSAILVVLADKDKPQYAYIAAVPVVLFFLLDGYYLHLERCFIGSYNKFLRHVHEGTATEQELFRIAPPRGLGTLCKGVGVSIFSVSVWPLYLTLAALTLLMRFLLFKGP